MRFQAVHAPGPNTGRAPRAPPLHPLLRPQAFLDKSGCQSALPKMVVQGYKELDLIYYFTGEPRGLGFRVLRFWV
jgi:hypothetical protein